MVWKKKPPRMYMQSYALDNFHSAVQTKEDCETVHVTCNFQDFQLSRECVDEVVCCFDHSVFPDILLVELLEISYVCFIFLSRCFDMGFSYACLLVV